MGLQAFNHFVAGKRREGLNPYIAYLYLMCARVLIVVVCVTLLGLPLWISLWTERFYEKSRNLICLRATVPKCRCVNFVFVGGL